MAGLSFAFDANAGETPQSIAQKRALIAQLMGSQNSPKTIGEGFGAIGNGIVANVLGSRAREAETAGQASANDTFGAITAMLTGQGGATPSTASGATQAMAGGDFMSGLINSESGGNWGALNDEGYGGRLQFGDARLADAAKAGVIPQGVTGAQFSQMSPEQQQAVEQWHFSDIDQQASAMGLDRYYGQVIAGVPINAESVRAMAHLGGIGGAQKFVTSGGQYNPADSNGTRLSDYGAKFGGATQPPAPVQVASLDQSIGLPSMPAQTFEYTAQLPPIGPAGGPSMAPLPQQVAQSAPAPVPAPPAPVQSQQGPSLQMLMEAAANPWLNESQKAIINTMISEQMQRQDPAYQQQMLAGQLGIEKSQLELDALRNPAPPAPAPVKYEVIDGQVVAIDPNSNSASSIGSFGQPATAPRPMTPQDREMWGIPASDTTPYYLDENGQPKAIGGGGQTINVGGQGEIGTIPPDYELITDPVTGARSMQIIPGSPSDRKAQAEAAAAQATVDADQSQASRYGNVVVEDIDRALGILANDPTWSTGILGQAMGNLKGSTSDRLNNLLDTVRANSAFDRLQAMRDASPTGGALGAVSERELGLLQSAIGSLETGNAEDLAYNLKRLQTIYSEIIDGPAAASQPNQTTVAPSDIDALLEKYQ